MSHSPMSRGRIRHLAARRCGFRAVSATQLQDLNEEIDTALARMAADCVEAFDMVETKVDALAVVSLSTYSAGVKRVSSLPAIINDRILEITDSDGTTLSNANWAPTTDGTWDGRMWLRVKSSDGRVYLMQSREWFYGVSLIGNPEAYYVSLVDPIPFPDQTVVTEVQIIQPHLWFPGDTTYIHNMGSDAQSFGNRITELDPTTAKIRTQSLRNELATGDVYNIWRDVRCDLPTPVEAPAITLHGSATWDNTLFPKCEMEVCYTYVWGRRTDLVHGESPRGIYAPLWESAPSPIGSYTMTSQTSAALIFTAANIDAQLGFSHPTLNSLVWEGKSGIRIRFYVRVKSLVASSGDARFHGFETSDKFMCLAEIEPTAKVGSLYASYTWDGTAIPDYESLLKPVPGYFGYAMYPLPSTDRVLDFTIRRQPHFLQDDNMTVHMHVDGREALLQLIISAIKQTDGDLGGAEIAEQKYYRLVDGLRARYGNHHAFGLPRGMGDDYILRTEQIITTA